MNLDLTTILYLAYIIAIGIAFAMVYTNIQRSAYIKFVDALMSAEAFSKDSSKTFKDLNIKGINKLIINSAVKNKHSLGKSISAVTKKSGNDALESFLAGNGNDTQFYIHDDNHTSLLDKYNYKPIKILHMIGYIFALFLAMIIFTIGTKMFFDEYITPKLESSQQEKVEEQISDFEGDNLEEKDDHDIPVVPTVPTLN